MGRGRVTAVAVDVLFLSGGDGGATDRDPDRLLKYFVDVLDTVQGARLHIMVEALFLNELEDLLHGDLA